VGFTLLSRTETVKRLIEIRKTIKNNEKQLNDASLNDLKNKIDNLLVDVIGAPEKLQYKVNEILSQVIDGNIKTNTALVAIHEIVKEGLEPDKYGKKQKEKYKKKNKSNYNQNNPNLNINELEKRGWNN